MTLSSRWLLLFAVACTVDGTLGSGVAVDDTTSRPVDTGDPPVAEDTAPPTDTETDTGAHGGDDTGDTGADTGAEPARLKLLTINLQSPLVEGFFVDERTQIVADLINEEQPDFVALQEVAESSTVSNRGEALTDATGYAIAWEVTHDWSLYSEGPAVLSRHPIVWSGSVDLPHTDFFGTVQRKAVGVTAATPYGDVTFVSSHNTLDEDEGVQADQAAAAYDFVVQHTTGLPAFYAGDLNATPESTAMRFLRGDADHNGATGDMVDAWLEANPGDDGFTFSASDPTKRIDYIYARPGAKGAAVVASCQHVLAGEVDGVRASDHIGVMCTVVLP